MSQLQQLIEQLYKSGSTELVIATGRPVSLRVHGQYKNLTSTPVNIDQMKWLVRDTVLVPMIEESGAGGVKTMTIHGRMVHVQVIRHGTDMMLQFERTDSPIATAAPARPPAEPAVTFTAKPRAASEPGVGPLPVFVPATPAPTPAPPSPVTPRAPEAPRPPPMVLVTGGPVPALPAETQLADERVEVVPALAALIQAARARHATDIHVAAGRAVAGRVIGELVTLEPTARTAAEVDALLLPLLGPMRREQLATRGYVDLAVEVPDAGRLRGNISRQQGGLKGAFRLAMPRPHSLAELGLPPELAKLTHNHQGLIVIAGPSGHGKTTTMNALVDLVNETEPVHILMIEDPVEIVHPRKAAVVSQREVGRHTLSFAAALKASLREDPDVIVIGELRDRETVEIAMTAAETGHLVIATMSTPSASKTIDRLIDMFPPDEQSQVRTSLAGALRAVVAQRLVPSLDGTSLVAAVEIVVGVLPLATLIRDNKLFQLPSLMQRGRSMGMRRLDDSLIELVRAGRISEEVAIATAESKKDVLATLHPEAAAAAAAAAPPSSMTTKLQRLGGLFGKRDKDPT